jgi:DNA invertase Pin-like site-specific DNA recombinase
MVERIVIECRRLAQECVTSWRPVNPEWPIVDGGAYLRLSDDQQVAVEKGSLEQQINIAVSEAVIRSNSDRINYRIKRFFIEPGITGTTDQRPEFQLLQREIKLGLYRFVVFKEIARIARDSSIWKSFFKLCIERDCEVFIRGLPINPNDPSQILQLDILASFAEYESNLISKRTRESNYSAMVTSGKFNSTRKILGFDQLVVNGEAKVGFYVPNPEELKVVEWIMRTFVKYASYQKTLEEIEKNGVQKKTEDAFARHSLITLLTNTRYIGKWAVNTDNKSKNQDKLMPYDRYAEIDLPHGCVIDLNLWHQVQATVKSVAGNKTKNTQVKRVYPLSTLLEYKDGTSFAGTEAWGRSGKNLYYTNKQNGIRIPAQILEDEAVSTVCAIFKSQPRLVSAVKKYANDIKETSYLLGNEIRRLEVEIADLSLELAALDKRLDFLLQGDESGAGVYRAEYLEKTRQIKAEIAQRRISIESIGTQKAEIDGDSFNWNDLPKRAGEIQKILIDEDPVALKNAYRKLFERIVVGEIDDQGVRSINFIVKDSSYGSAVIAADTCPVLGKEWGE